MSLFKKAVKSQAKLRMAIIGPSGSGKTYSALAIAAALTDQPIALVDTENRSASKYADRFGFDVLEMDAPFHPDRFVQAIKEAQAAGYGAIVLDSLSHAWNGPGGVLELVDEAAARLNSKNTFAAWKDVTPIQNRLVEAIIRSDIHLIATMRSKQEYILEEVSRNGRTVTQPRKVGMAPIQRDSFDYEFDIVGEMSLEHNMVISKTRCATLDNRVFKNPGDEVAGIIKAWLSDGEQPAPIQLVAPPHPEHWSGKQENRKTIAKKLATKGIAIELLFAACEVADWADMVRYEGTGQDALRAAEELAAQRNGQPEAVAAD